ncbi:hypothetical protein GQX73_g6554 [Xylaria multiplex]|uniref:Myb-like domain-containing protein n=1 Tax=Xylaria multiplex TaxID=323545 RepID=A0A7C8MKG0_9PEZI|nr:hypothetical protein GQX73_g6554 [Xylaria multiplex]
MPPALKEGELSQKEMAIVAYSRECIKTSMDWDKLALIAGYKSKGAAMNIYYSAKKKLDAATGKGKRAAEDTDTEGEQPAQKKTEI